MPKNMIGSESKVHDSGSVIQFGGHFWATLLPHTMRMRSCCIFTTSSVAVMMNKNKNRDKMTVLFFLGSYVTESSDARHPLSPVIKSGIRHPRKKGKKLLIDGLNPCE